MVWIKVGKGWAGYDKGFSPKLGRPWVKRVKIGQGLGRILLRFRLGLGRTGQRFG